MLKAPSLTMKLVPTTNEITPLTSMARGVLLNMAISGVAWNGLIARGHVVLALNVPDLHVAASVTSVMRNVAMTISNSTLPERVMYFFNLNLDL